MALDPARTVAELRELRELTGDENGAQRVAWTETWETARAWLRDKLASTGAREEIDEAGNQWFTLAGRVRARAPDRRPHRLRPERRLARRLPERRRRRRGAAPDRRGGHAAGDRCASSTGPTRRARASAARSSAPRPRPARCATRTSCAKLTDRDGIALPDALREHGVDLDRALEARSQLEGAGAYLELHIEQGPVLESLDLPLGVVLGTFGVERSRITWRGQAAHSGSTPMDQRRDALAGAAKLALEIREIAARGRRRRRLHLRQRRLQAGDRHLGRRDGRAAARPAPPRRGDARAACSQLAQEASARFAAEENIEVEWERIWQIEPILFDETLIGFADEAIREVAGTSHRLPSGPLHDAAEVVARRGPDGDGLRPEPARPLAHEARGHEARAPRARRSQALDRPRVEDARLARGREPPSLALLRPTTGFRSTPIPSISISTTSPCCIDTGGVARAPTPAASRSGSGRPARACRRRRDVRDEAADAEDRSAVLPSCSTSPFSRCTTRRPLPSPSSDTGTSRSPSGQNVSKPLPRVHCLSPYWRFRAETSLAQR